MNPDTPHLPGNIPTRSDDFVLEELDGDLLLFNPQNGRLLELNSTAALVWQLCDGARPLSEIETLLAELYPDAAPAIAADLPNILSNLKQLGALT
jgi:hypothetical protein